MNAKTRKILGIGGGTGIVISCVALFLSGANASAASGIVGLAFAAIAAVVAVINGVKK